MSLYSCPASSDKLHDQDDHCDHQQGVNQAARHTTQQAEQPKDE